MLKAPLIDLGRIERAANTVSEAVKQLKSSIENSSTKLNAAMLREQTLANVNVILALYNHDYPEYRSEPTIIIADNKKQMYAAVVRTYYNEDLGKTEMATTIEGPSCASDYEALEALYKLSRAAVQRAKIMSKNDEGFYDWEDLDLP